MFFVHTHTVNVLLCIFGVYSILLVVAISRPGLRCDITFSYYYRLLVGDVIVALRFYI